MAEMLAANKRDLRRWRRFPYPASPRRASGVPRRGQRFPAACYLPVARVA